MNFLLLQISPITDSLITDSIKKVNDETLLRDVKY